MNCNKSFIRLMNLYDLEKMFWICYKMTVSDEAKILIKAYQA